MKLHNYYLALNRGDENAPLIFQTKEPYIVGKIWTFKDLNAWTNFTNNYSGMALVSIPGYTISITMFTTLTGRINATPGTIKLIYSILNEMAEFYLAEKIKDKPGYFNKFKL